MCRMSVDFRSSQNVIYKCVIVDVFSCIRFFDQTVMIVNSFRNSRRKTISVVVACVYGRFTRQSVENVYLQVDWYFETSRCDGHSVRLGFFFA